MSAWLSWPRAVDAYLDDHFAFRLLLTSAANNLRWKLGGQLDGGAVVRGRADRLFLRDNLLNVSGGTVREDVAEDYGAFVCDLNRRLTARAVPMVFSMAPSPAAIYPEDLPDWVPRGRSSAYDLILDRTRVCGVAAVDLRPSLRAAKPGGSIYYHHDTHWTQKGALIAYDQLVTALKRPDWRLDQRQLSWRRTVEDNSDLLHLSGVASPQREMMDRPDLTATSASLTRGLLNGIADYPGRAGFIDTTGHAGPTVLFIGDSYSADFMPPYFAAHVGRFAWIHQQWCRFDWRVFDVVRPDYVVLMPVDRWASCEKRGRPLHMPRSGA